MTPEQKQQRLERIRKDADECYGFRNHTPAGHEPLIEKACDDIKLLLSLVSQEAGSEQIALTDREFYARGLARSRYHDKLFAQGKPRPSNEQFDEGWDAARRFYTATVRSACVEKVKAMRNDWQIEADARRDPDNPHEYKGSYGLAVGAVDACDDIITALESVTIQEQEAKQS